MLYLFLGYGSSAIVYKAIYKPLNRRMALKMIDLDKFERNQIDELRVSCWNASFKGGGMIHTHTAAS